MSGPKVVRITSRAASELALHQTTNLRVGRSNRSGTTTQEALAARFRAFSSWCLRGALDALNFIQVLINSIEFGGRGPKVAHALLAGFLPLAAQDWTPRDTAWETACLSAIVVDWGQTRDIVRHPYEVQVECPGVQDQFGYWHGRVENRWRREEVANPFLPSRPSMAEVDRYFVASLGAHYFGARLLHGKWRRGFQMVTFAMEGVIVRRNARLGLRVTF